MLLLINQSALKLSIVSSHCGSVSSLARHTGTTALAVDLTVEPVYFVKVTVGEVASESVPTSIAPSLLNLFLCRTAQMMIDDFSLFDLSRADTQNKEKQILGGGLTCTGKLCVKHVPQKLKTAKLVLTQK